jgi:dihydrofolate synthase/folylpolyglutamate synthase
MGNPERDLPSVVQVVGTNGKGTTAVALAAAFEAMGRPAGAFLSPHVLSYTERVLLGGGRVSEADFATAMGQTIEIADRNGIPVSQFEILTAGALAMFAEAGLSLAVLEAGLGARYDATSVAGSGSRLPSGHRSRDASRCASSTGYPSFSTAGTMRPGCRRLSGPCATRTVGAPSG